MLVTRGRTGSKNKNKNKKGCEETISQKINNQHSLWNWKKMVNIADELASYGAYHTNHANQIIHIICVPMILWSAFLLLGMFVHRSVPFFAWLAYSLFYFYLDPLVGTVATAFYFGIWSSCDKLLAAQEEKRGAKAVSTISRSQALQWALLAQVVGWGVQGKEKMKKKLIIKLTLSL